jgi:hypothetical protein
MAELFVLFAIGIVAVGLILIYWDDDEYFGGGW